MFSRLAIGLLASSLLASGQAAEPLRYRWQAEQQFVYDVQITAELPTTMQTMKGIIVYQVKSTDTPLRIGYRGHLTLTAKPTEEQVVADASPFGRPPPIPDMLGPGGWAQPVNPFPGLAPATNQISLTATGGVLELQGNSQLPHLLGHLSLLVFEPLPDEAQDTWTVEGGVVIEERASGDAARPHLHPIMEALRQNADDSNPQKTRSGGSARTFTRESETGDIVTFQTTYRLDSRGDAQRISVDGAGRWTFNRKLGMSESLDMRQRLTMQETNLSFTIPLTIKYRRLSDEEFGKIETARLEAERANRQHAERLAAEERTRAAAAKAQAEAPLDGDERKRVLAALSSATEPEVVATLTMLAGKSSRSDEELAKAIEPLLHHRQAAVRERAQPALAAFSADFKRRYELNRAYTGSEAVRETGLWVAHDTPLPTGLIVAANHWYEERSYFPAKVVSVLADGQVKVAHVDRGGTENRLREDLCLAPPEVEQPALDATQQAAVQAYRQAVQVALGETPTEATRRERLNRAYRDATEALPEVGSAIPEHIPLPKFLVVAARRKDQWYRARVSGMLPDGRIAVRFPGEPLDVKRSRSDLRLPPPEVTQPNVPLPAATSSPGESAAPFRTWTDTTGQFSIEAKFVAEDGDKVRLVNKDGKELKVPLAKLREADRQYVESLRQPAPANPFAQ